MKKTNLRKLQDKASEKCQVRRILHGGLIKVSIWRRVELDSWRKGSWQHEFFGEKISALPTSPLRN